MNGKNKSNIDVIFTCLANLESYYQEFSIEEDPRLKQVAMKMKAIENDVKKQVSGKSIPA